MTGQDAARAAKAFDEALSAYWGRSGEGGRRRPRRGRRYQCARLPAKPIKFMGVGEGTDGLEPFHPDRVASRILGMGDVLSLIEEAERKVDKQKAQRPMPEKVAGGRRFDLEDFRDQLQQMARMGGIGSMLDRLPGANQLPQAGVDDGDIRRMEAMINSMTLRERRFPDTINGSRKRRISAGSGTRIQDVNRLLKQHKQMQKVMRKATRRGGMDKMMRRLQAQSQVAQATPFSTLTRGP